MKKRGKILRDPRSSAGLVMIEGRQCWFSMDGTWKSEVPPVPGLDVEVKFDQTGQILAITALSDVQLTQKPSPRSVASATAAGAKILRKIAAKCGLPNFPRR